MPDVPSIGLVTDAHHSAQPGTKVGSAAEQLLCEFKHWADLFPSYAPGPLILSPALCE